MYHRREKKRQSDIDMDFFIQKKRNKKRLFVMLNIKMCVRNRLIFTIHTQKLVYCIGDISVLL
jgi:hypothetical protein